MLKNELVFGRKKDVFGEIKKWKNENKEVPIFIWGTGSVAVGVYKNLLKRDIKVNGLFYDTNNVVIDPRLEEEKENIYSLKELLCKYNKFSVIIGHSRYEIAEKIRKIDKVIKIWALTGIIRLGIEIDEEFILENLKNYEYTYSKLSDEKSKKNMVSYLNAHLTNDCEEILNGFNGAISFFKNDIFSLGNEEVYCDCGAYDGKSAKDFLDSIDNRYKKMVLIEVMHDMYEKLQNIKLLRDDRIEIYNIGLSDHEGEDCFQFDDQSTCLSSEGEKVHVTTLDKIMGTTEVSLIKIAIGNSIDKILTGAADIIKRDLPKIVIMVGVDKRALVDYVGLLEKIAGKEKYQYFLRFTNATTDCLCLFVVPAKN